MLRYIRKSWFPTSRLVKFECLAFILYFMGQFPGRVGADANTAMFLMRNDSSTANWTQLYFWFLKILTFNGEYIALATGFGFAFFMFAIHMFVTNLWKSTNFHSETIYLIVIFSPLIGVYGMTLDHNLQANTGNILLISLLLKILRRETLLRKDYVLLVCSVLLATMSFIGIAAVAGFVFSLILVRKSIKFVGGVVVLCAAVILAGNALPVEPRALGFKYSTLLEDIRCLVPNPHVKISSEDLAVLEKLGPMKIWLEPISCVTAESAEFVRLKVTPQNERAIQKVWLHLFRDNPRYILIAHLQRGSVALPPGISGPQPNGYETNLLVPLGQGMPRWLHLWNGAVDDSRYQTGHIQAQPGALKYLQYLIIFPSIILNNASWIWGWGGLWLLIGTVIVIRMWGIRGTILMTPIYFAHLFLFIMIPTPDPRYTYLAITVGLLLLSVRKTEFVVRDWK